MNNTIPIDHILRSSLDQTELLQKLYNFCYLLTQDQNWMNVEVIYIMYFGPELNECRNHYAIYFEWMQVI